MGKIKISIIIPVYNSEKYISDCINSMINQNFEDFEIILVNDGSTDNSGEICREFAEKNNKITFINKKNGGLCSARNAGIDAANGDYLMFVDNDDELVDGALNVIWKAISELKCDILRFNRKRVQIFEDEDTKEDIYGCIGICDGNQKVFMSKEAFFSKYRNVRSSGCFSGIWNGAFKKDLFDNLRFDTRITAGGEDWIINLELYDKCNSVGFISDVLYIYYRRMSHSVSTTYQENRMYSIVLSANKERKLIEKNNVPIYELLHSDIIYISQIIKIMMHPDSGLNMGDKIKILSKVSKEPGLDFNIGIIIKAYIPLSEKIYLLVYKFKMYHLLIKMSEIILKRRGNT